MLAVGRLGSVLGRAVLSSTTGSLAHSTGFLAGRSFSLLTPNQTQTNRFLVSQKTGPSLVVPSRSYAAPVERTSLQLTDVAKLLPDRTTLFENVNISFFYGAKIGVLGVNGSGKTSLLKVIAGVDDDFYGTRKLFPGFKLGYLEQEPKLDPNLTVHEIIMESVKDKLKMSDAYERIKTAHEEAISRKLPAEKIKIIKDQLDKLHTTVVQLGIRGLRSKIDQAMNALRCPPPESYTNNLSGGEKRRVSLCALLISQPDVLLLDEPTNHLDAESVAWLERFLSEYKGTVIAITHDRYFLDNVAGYILEIDRGRMIPFKGNYTDWLQAKSNRIDQEGKNLKSKEKNLKRELEWIQASKRTKQTLNKARMGRIDELKSSISFNEYRGGSIVIPPGPKLGEDVISCENLTKRYGDRVLFENLSLTIPRASIVGIIGPNGSGKSTLFRIIAGQEQPDTGTVRIGRTVQMGFVEQSRAKLNDENTIYEEIAEGKALIAMGDGEMDIRKFIANFSFSGEDQKKLIGNLSGGERNRVHLAKVIKAGPNLLMLDEPTNDLDVEVLRSLEEGLVDFEGTAVIVSHDRWFLDRLCTHIISFEEDRVFFFGGNYSAYAESYRQRSGRSIGQIQYKKLGF